MKKDFKRRLAYEILIFMGLMALLFVALRMWPVVLIFILGIFAAALRYMFLSASKVEIIKPEEPVETVPKRPDTEQDVVRQAYGVIQRRITEAVDEKHPSARWVWKTPNSISCIEKDEPVSIILNGAGGYKLANVRIHNLQFTGIDYVTVETDATPRQETETASEKEAGSQPAGEDTQEENAAPVNYELLAFEWVDENIGMLNQRCNEAIAQKDEYLFIPATDLPVEESWDAVCAQLLNDGFSLAMKTEEGIKLNLPQ